MELYPSVAADLSSVRQAARQGALGMHRAPRLLLARGGKQVWTPPGSVVLTSAQPSGSTGRPVEGDSLYRAAWRIGCCVGVVVILKAHLFEF